MIRSKSNFTCDCFCFLEIIESQFSCFCFLEIIELHFPCFMFSYIVDILFSIYFLQKERKRKKKKKSLLIQILFYMIYIGSSSFQFWLLLGLFPISYMFPISYIVLCLI